MPRSAIPRRLAPLLASRSQTGTALLLAASLIVGIAIASPDPLSRVINGISGVLWIAAATLVVRALRNDAAFWRRLALVVALGMVLVLLVRPSDLLLAMLGFGAAGALIAALLGERGLAWATVLPALWLPEHLLTAVARALYRSARDLPASVRSEPPPTAALVPFAMVVSAIGAAWLVRRLLGRSRPVSESVRRTLQTRL